MKRFIHHSELARDRRFVRQDNVAATVLSTLPDDVFTEQEPEELRTISSQGPSKDTLLPAARILRERHKARRAAEGGERARA